MKILKRWLSCLRAHLQFQAGPHGGTLIDTQVSPGSGITATLHKFESGAMELRVMYRHEQWRERGPKVDFRVGNGSVPKIFWKDAQTLVCEHYCPRVIPHSSDSYDWMQDEEEDPVAEAPTRARPKHRFVETASGFELTIGARR